MLGAHRVLRLLITLAGLIFSECSRCAFTDIMDSKGLDQSLIWPVKKGHNLQACKDRCLTNPECWSTSFHNGYCYQFIGVEYVFAKREILSRKSCDVHEEDMEKIISHEQLMHGMGHSKHKAHAMMKIERPTKYAFQCDGHHSKISLSCDRHKDGGDMIHIVQANYGRNDTTGKTCNPHWESTCKHHKMKWNGGKAHVCEAFRQTCYLDVVGVFDHHCEAKSHCELKQEASTFHNATVKSECKGVNSYSEVWYQCSNHVVLDRNNHKRKCWKH